MYRRVSPRIWPTAMKKSWRPFGHALKRQPIVLSLIFASLSTVLLLMWIWNTDPVNAQSTDSSPDAVTLQVLTTQAEISGTVRVIVQLNTNFAPVGGLSSISAFAQGWRISTVQTAITAQVNAANARVLSTFDAIPYMVIEANAKGLAELAALDEVVAIVEDKLNYPTLASSVPNIQGDQAWAAGHTGSRQAVAIIDTGVETDHDAFGNGSRIVAEACYSTTSSANNTISLCPNQASSSTATGSGADCVDTATALGYSGAASECTHGTHVAGIAAGDDGSSNIGVAPDADIIAIQAASLVTSSDSVGFYTSDIIRGLQYVLTLHNSGNYSIAAVNMSLGDGTENSSYCDSSESARKAAIDNLRSVGIATIVAAGNEGYTDGINAPACISSAVSVGATYDGTDQIVDFSNISSYLDLLAPGTYIDAAVPGNSTGEKRAPPWPRLM
ncbi:MAG: S8 family serine peptidase [Caldilineaceae bacterium]